MDLKFKINNIEREIKYINDILSKNKEDSVKLILILDGYQKLKGIENIYNEVLTNIFDFENTLGNVSLLYKFKNLEIELLHNKEKIFHAVGNIKKRKEDYETKLDINYNVYLSYSKFPTITDKLFPIHRFYSQTLLDNGKVIYNFSGNKIIYEGSVNSYNITIDIEKDKLDNLVLDLSKLHQMEHVGFLFESFKKTNNVKRFVAIFGFENIYGENVLSSRIVELYNDKNENIYTSDVNYEFEEEEPKNNEDYDVVSYTNIDFQGSVEEKYINNLTDFINEDMKTADFAGYPASLNKGYYDIISQSPPDIETIITLYNNINRNSKFNFINKKTSFMKIGLELHPEKKMLIRLNYERYELDDYYTELINDMIKKNIDNVSFLFAIYPFMEIKHDETGKSKIIIPSKLFLGTEKVSIEPLTKFSKLSNIFISNLDLC